MRHKRISCFRCRQIWYQFDRETGEVVHQSTHHVAPSSRLPRWFRVAIVAVVSYVFNPIPRDVEEILIAWVAD